MSKNSPPSGCQHCGNDARTHAIEYVEGIGYHNYDAPDTATIRARMTARKKERDAGSTPPVRM